MSKPKQKQNYNIKLINELVLKLQNNTSTIEENTIICNWLCDYWRNISMKLKRYNYHADNKDNELNNDNNYWYYFATNIHKYNPDRAGITTFAYWQYRAYYRDYAIKYKKDKLTDNIFDDDNVNEEIKHKAIEDYNTNINKDRYSWMDDDVITETYISNMLGEDV